MDKEPKRIPVGEIRQALRENKNLVDGKLKFQEEGWVAYDSVLESFGLVFDKTLPEKWVQGVKMADSQIKDRELFRKYITETLGIKPKKSLTAVEFGGSGSNLFWGFGKDYFKASVGVCLRDIRNSSTKKMDEEGNHSVITGDILDVVNNDELYRKIEQAIGSQKADLIISSIKGPLQSVRAHPAIIDRIIRKWYHMLNSNGLMFVQFTYSISERTGEIGNLVKAWERAVKDRFPDLDLQVNTSGTDGILRIHKKAGDPDELPPATQLFKEAN